MGELNQHKLQKFNKSASLKVLLGVMNVSFSLKSSKYLPII